MKDIIMLTKTSLQGIIQYASHRSFFWTSLIFLLCTYTSYGQKLMEDSVVIPNALRITPNHLRQLPMYERQFMLSELSQGDRFQVFQAPPCMEGSFYLAIQLFYDLGNRSTNESWKTDLNVALLYNQERQWSKKLSLDMTEQLFISTVFHDVAISCDKNFEIQLLNKETTSSPLNNIYVRVLLFQEETKSFDFTVPLELTVNSGNEENTIAWSYRGAGVTEYDVEWIFIDQYSTVGGSTPQLFEAFEPVRVTSNDSYFVHSVLYPTGKLLYRVRPVSYVQGNRLTGDWTYSDAIDISSSQELCNYTSTTEFDMGKFEKSVIYRDAAWNERQRLVLSSDKVASIVTERLYDFEGRPAVDVLPVPIKNRTVKYQQNLNEFQAVDSSVSMLSKGPRDKYHFDNGDVENSKMSDKSGAARYYSPQNDTQDPIADGEGFVYRQMNYEHDLSDAKSLANAGYALRTDGDHALKVYQGAAPKEETIRLLGSQGLHQNLRKEVIVNENGETKVHYLNERDQSVIESVVEKGNNTSTVDPIQIDLLQNDSFDFVIVNTKPGTVYDFSYSSDGDHLINFELSIISPQGLELPLPLPGNESNDSGKYVRHNISPRELASIQFQLTFEEIGGYTVSRKISPFFRSETEVINEIKSGDDFSNLSSAIISQHTYDSMACASCHELNPEVRFDRMVDLIRRSVHIERENYHQLMIKDYQLSHSSGSAISEDSLRNHSLYQTYSFMGKNHESLVFDRTMAIIRDWDEARAKGFIDAIKLDPFFNDTSQDGYSFKSIMEDRLQNITLATVIHENDTMVFNGTLSEVIDPDNTTFYINANGLPDKVGGIHPLYLELLTRRNSMSTDAFRSAVKEKRWDLYRTFYLRAKKDLIASINTSADTLGVDNEKRILSAEVYAENTLEVMEWSFNKQLSMEDRHNIKSLLSSYFSSDLDNFLHVILAEDIKTNDNLLAVQNILNKYGCDLTYIGQNDRLECMPQDKLQQDRVVVNPESAEQAPDPSSKIESTQSKQEPNTPDPPVSKAKSDDKDWIGYSIKSTRIATEEYKALRALYNKMGGASWKNNRGWRGSDNNVSDVSGWFGVITNPEGHVVAIQLPDNNLQGNLPEELGAFTELRFLDLGSLSKGGNRIAGSIPSTLGNLSNLVYLNLENNELRGSFPSQVYRLTHLSSLNLSGNEFSGTLTSDIGKLTALSVLELSNNKMTGSIPMEIGNLSKLKQLDLSHNELTNSIPASIGNLGQLTKLDLSHNRLKGGLPVTWGGLKNIRYIRLNNNQLQYDIPESFGSLKSLSQLDLSYNELTGHLPKLSHAYSLQHLSVAHNQIAGSIPGSLGELSALKSLNLAMNKLEGSLPNELFQSSSLEYLDASGNMLTGEIPSNISRSSKLQTLLLSENNLTGALPESIGELQSLQELGIHHNKFSGSIEPATSIKGLKLLQAGNNQFEGKLPVTFGELKDLEVLLLEFNQFSDSIPNALASANKLQRINLSGNRFSGPIPDALGELSDLQELTLNDNSLTGTIPSTLNRVARLVVTNNHLSGALPVFVSQQREGGDAVWLSYNSYTFADMVSLKDQIDVDAFLFHRQDSIDDKKVVPLFVDQPFELVAHVDRNVSPPCTYQWFKYVDGISDEPLNQSSTEGHTIIADKVTAFHNGERYYYKVTNSELPGLTLVSNLQTIIALPGNSLCVRFNPLETFNTTVDKTTHIKTWQNRLAEEQKALSKHEVQSLLDYKVAETLMDKPDLRERFTVTYTPVERNYVVRYFDDAGNMVRSIPSDQTATLTSEEIEKVLSGDQILPHHGSGTEIINNSNNQILTKIENNSKTLYGYNMKGLLRWMQEESQRHDNRLTYFRYDEQGRVIESGELRSKRSILEMNEAAEDAHFPSEKDGQLSNIVITRYDKDVRGNLARGHVVQREWRAHEKDSPSITNFSYDLNGHLAKLEQRDENYENKMVVFRHEPLSGRLLYQFYQPGYDDQFIQHFSYNALGGLTQVNSSADGFIWSKEATYSYFDHGPLKQVSLGEYDVQNSDYAYTIQGWLKGVNSFGKSTASTSAKDVYAYSLEYYTGDFQPISGTNMEHAKGTELFNGDIAGTYQRVESLGDSTLGASMHPDRLIYDLTGNVLAAYNGDKLEIIPIYGQTLIGSYSGSIMPGIRKLGARRFVLQDHNDLPMATISDEINIRGQQATPTLAKKGLETVIQFFNNHGETKALHMQMNSSRQRGIDSSKK